jgi:hypothetical protein
MKRLTLTVSAAIEVLLIAASAYLATDASRLAAQHSYRFIAMPRVSSSPENGIGGCGYFSIDTIEVTPHLVVPDEVALGNSFLIGLQLDLTDAHATLLGASHSSRP